MGLLEEAFSFPPQASLPGAAHGMVPPSKRDLRKDGGREREREKGKERQRMTERSSLELKSFYNLILEVLVL